MSKDAVKILEAVRKYNSTSNVEETEIRRSKRKLIYSPTEKIASVEVDNFPLLGKLTALRFIEWVLKNPGGAISLPTGRTPEFYEKVRELKKITEAA